MLTEPRVSSTPLPFPGLTAKTEKRPAGLWLCLIFLVFSLLMGAATWMTRIEFDSAFNLQVAQSLRETFSYQTRYVPIKVYHDKVTTNGPIQYFMASMIGLFGLDLGRSIALGVIAGLAAVTIFLYSRQSFTLYCLLLLFWPTLAWAHSFYWGEVLTITMIIAGIMAWERWLVAPLPHTPDQHRVSRHPWRTPHLWLSGLAFGVAISTKLLAAPVILLLLFCLSACRVSEGNSTLNSPSPRTRAAYFGTWLVTPYSIAIAVFGLQFSASILHSGGHLDTIWPTLKLFVESHFQQAGTASKFVKLGLSLTSMDSPALVMLIGLLALLARRHMVFLLLGVAIATLLLVGHLDPRRLLTLIVPVMLMAAKEDHEGSAHDPVTEKKWMTALFPSPLWVLSAILMAWSFWAKTPISYPGVLSHFTLAGAARNTATISVKSRNKTHYDDSLIPTIKALPGRVLTSGWWQYPEISLRTNTIFYDRLAPENSHLLHGGEACFLLFSSENPQDHSTEHDLCGEIIYRDGSLILCRYRPQ